MAERDISIVEEMKELLADPKNRIKLDDYIAKHLKIFLSATDIDRFPFHGVNPEKENFLDRLHAYEAVANDLQQIIILLARWGEGTQLSFLEKIFQRLSEVDKGTSGNTLWINLDWYPIQILMYSAGIAALYDEKYNALRIILTTLVQNRTVEEGYLPLIVTLTQNLSNIHDAFKWIPGKEDKYVPRSEYLFQVLEPILEEIIFVGKSYEQLFDDFEVYCALLFADASGRDWGPIGRFGWKYRRGIGDSPFNRIIEEAKKK